MATYIAFLRAINLGANRRFPKDRIVAATQAAGGSDVATHIASGNVRLATAMRSRARIEAALEEAYRESQGFEVPTIVFSQAELRRVADDADDIGEGFDGSHYVSLLKDEPSAEVAAAVEALGQGDDRAVVRGRGVHLLVVDPYHQARLTNADVEKRLGVSTNRNAGVIRTLRQKWC